MKQLLMVLFLGFCSFNLYSQTNSEPYKILICKDKMEDKTYAFGNKRLMCVKEDGKEGFVVRISWNVTPRGEVKYQGLAITSNIGGKCVEKSQIIFLFSDDTKWNATAFNDFNCDGNSYFDFINKGFAVFTTKKLSAIRFTNGRGYESFTYNVSESESEFFIEARKALEQKNFDMGSVGDGGPCDN